MCCKHDEHCRAQAALVAPDGVARCVPHHRQANDGRIV